ncbi:hypothetical protein BGZ65_009195 [Modicella reniformis]|uniref:Uncharacterized protein n=1 Tax=Modicella reniformis TaxID=1440133 RepID=A0A9P6J4S9_9FUNG|nr:hypothetical protein BGZ65_009195 [Modicella reniformis]
MIDRQGCLELKTFLTPYLAWHPHLPSLESLYDLYSHQPNKSTSLLLASMYLVASRHRQSLSSSLMKSLSATVDRLAAQVILSSVRDIRLVQAFEFLLAHEPSLVGTAVCGDQEGQACRGNGLAGESVLANALSISRDLGIDKSFQALQRHLDQPYDKEQQHQLTELMNSASLWVSLRLWEGHYVFVRPVTRVLRDLEDLAERAKCLIAIDGAGNKVHPPTMTADGISASSIIDHGIEAEERLRSAGRTVLAYRMQSMALVQGSLAKIEDVLTPKGQEVPWTQQQESERHAYSTPKSATSLEVKDKIVHIVVSTLEEQTQIDRGKQMDMAPFTLYHPANLAEEWSELESNTIFSILCTFGVCSLYTGQFDTGFSTRAFIETLQRDKELSDRVGLVGKSRLSLSEGLVSSFAFFNRRMTISSTTTTANSRTSTTTASSFSSTMDSAAQRRQQQQQQSKDVMELTGAPIFLTCALVIDACKLFLEGAAFVLITYSVIQQHYDSRMLSMVQAAQRLEEFDGNRYYNQEEEDKQDEDEDEYDEGDSDDAAAAAAKAKAQQQPPPPLSICQVAAKFIKEMVETLQKWKLATSIYRRARIHVESTGKSTSTASSPSTQMQDVTTTAGGVSSMQNVSTHDNSKAAQEAVLHGFVPSSRIGHDHNNPMLVSMRNQAPDMITASTAAAAAGHHLVGMSVGPYIIPHAAAAGWPGGYMHPAVSSETHMVGQAHHHPQSQAHFAFPGQPPQFWPMEIDQMRTFGPAENLLLAGAFGTTEPVVVSSGDNAAGAYDIPLFNSFFDSFMPL